MKNYLIATLIALFALGFTSCSKYEDGPFMSFSSPEKRIAGDYTVEAYYIDNELITLNEIGISQYRLVYNEDGTGTSYITVNDFTSESEFEWELDEKKENIRERVKGQNDQWSAWSEYKQVLRLTKTEFWFIDNNSQEITEFHLIEQ